MNNNFSISIGTVKAVENANSKDSYDGLRIRVKLDSDQDKANPDDYPWAFPLLPKVFQSIPKEGEAVFVFMKDGGDKQVSQRYFLGPIISQPQYFSKCERKKATSLLNSKGEKPISKIPSDGDSKGAFPKNDDVAIIGREKEDIILRGGNGSSEIDLRAGIRTEPTNSSDPNLTGNIIFNGTDPAYIQLKYKKGLVTRQKNSANSVINMVANRINIMSNKDEDIAHNLKDNNTLIAESKMDEIMDKLHPLPKGDKLIELLNLMKGAIMNHVHPWAGMKQCGDEGGYINALREYDVYSILSDYVRIS